MYGEVENEVIIEVVFKDTDSELGSQVEVIASAMIDQPEESTVVDEPEVANRFIPMTTTDLNNFQDEQKNKETMKKTKGHLKLLRSFLGKLLEYFVILMCQKIK